MTQPSRFSPLQPLPIVRRYVSILACHGLLALTACGDPTPADGSGSGTDASSTGTTDGTGTAPTTGPGDPTTGEPEDPTTGDPDDPTTGEPDDTSTGDTSTGDTSTGDTSTGTTEAIGDSTTGSTGDTTDTTTGSTGDTDTSTGSTGDTDTTTGSTTEDEDSSTTDGENEACATPDLLSGPAPVMVDGLLAVPIDIQSVTATVVLDATAKGAQAESTMLFRSGPQDGHPIFDLRQQIVTATLDGESIDPASLALHDFGPGINSGLRIIEKALPACTDHTLVLTYALNKPNAPNSRGITWLQGSTRVKWDFWSSDLYPGRYLEQWFPANLIHDMFPFSLDLTLNASDFEHTLVSNGEVELAGPGHWKVSYPPTFTALSPMLVLVANDRVVAETHPLELAGDLVVTLDAYRDLDVPVDLTGLAADIAVMMDDFITTVGPWAHGDRLTVYIWNEASRSMEYDGATTTRLDALEHELFHSWYGRGVKPAGQSDGWIDEAWDVHSVDLGFNAFPLNFNAPPVELSAPSPWNRTTPSTAYDQGERVFAGLAATLGIPQLRALMAGFYSLHILDVVTTRDLERHLYCATGEPQVLAAFHRFVYGKAGEPPAPAADYCD